MLGVKLILRAKNEFANDFGHVDVVHGRHLNQGHVVHWVGVLREKKTFKQLLTLKKVPLGNQFLDMWFFSFFCMN